MRSDVPARGTSMLENRPKILDIDDDVVLVLNINIIKVVHLDGDRCVDIHIEDCWISEWSARFILIVERPVRSLPSDFVYCFSVKQVRFKTPSPSVLISRSSTLGPK